MKIKLLLLLLAAVLFISATVYKKELPIPGEVFKVKGCTAFVIMPENKTYNNSALPWVWYAPTLPNLPAKEETWMFQKILDAGIAIAGIDVGESMGNPKGRNLYSALYSELVWGRHFSKQPVLLARSRGGLMLYNWAIENPKKVSAIAGIYPVVDLRSYPGIDKAAKAYDMSVEKMTSELSKHSPVYRLRALAKEGIPILHIHGDADTLVPLEENSAKVARQYKIYGGKMILLIQKGKGHDMWKGWFHSEELVDFVIAHSLQIKPPRR